MKRPVPASARPLRIPAPMGGLNTIASGADMPPGDCLQAYNLVSGEHGLRARLGYAQYGTLASASAARTVVPYIAGSGNPVDDRLIVLSRQALGSVSLTTGTSTPWPIVNGDSGRGIAHAFTTSGGHFLLYCDEANGYWVYTESTDSWAQVTQGGAGNQISGVDPANFCFVTVWKSRVWFVEKNTTNAWYLAAGSIFGTATKLNLDRSAQFRSGGPLAGLWSWTLDGGIGIDDHLVAVSVAGEVAVYKGSDPASASTFELKGTWSAGAMVAGRRIATNFGGDLLLLTKSGIRPLSQLVAGEDGIQTYATAKISNLFNALALTRGDLPGWDMCLHPEENALIVTVPKPGADDEGNNETEQLVFSLWNKSWSRYPDLPILAMCVWQKRLFFSTRKGVGSAVGNALYWFNTGYVDAYGAEAAPTAITPVQWQLLTPFAGSGRNTQVQLIRPRILADSVQPVFQAEARYNYDLSQIATLSGSSPNNANVWGGGTWDSSVWRDDYQSYAPLAGGAGMGTDVAISIRGTSIARTVLVGIDVFLTEGDFL